MTDTIDRDAVLAAPQMRLVGSVDEAMYNEFRDQLAAAPDEGPLVLALTTLGGNPEIARAMGDDVRLLRETGREIIFLGKAAVYSAGKNPGQEGKGADRFPRPFRASPFGSAVLGLRIFIANGGVRIHVRALPAARGFGRLARLERQLDV